MKLYYLVFICLGVLSCKKDNNNNKTSIRSKDSIHSSFDSISSFDTIIHKEQKKSDNTKYKQEKRDTSLHPKIVSSSIINRKIKSNKSIKDSTKYYIYFTLDDGPQLPGTQICKNILEKNNIKATFFMVGTHDSGEKCKKLVDSLNNNPLFIVSNHSHTHANNRYTIFYKNAKSTLQDFIIAEKKLNIKHKIARLPGRNTWALDKKITGESSAFGVAEKLDSLGYFVYGWDLEWRFIHGNIPVESTTEMVKKVKKTLKYGQTHSPNSIVILVHDRMFSKPQYADSLQKFLSLLKNNDQYVFETLDNYPSLSLINNNH